MTPIDALGVFFSINPHLKCSVLWIWDVYPVSSFFIIPGPRFRIQQHQKRRGKNWCFTFLLGKKIPKMENYFILEQVRKDIKPIDKELYYLLPKKCH
jgi:hypothetical protein